MTQLPIPVLEHLDDAQLRSCLGAIADIRESYRLLKKGGLNIVGEVLKGQGAFYEMDHYPNDDVYDRETASQYYYHAHRDDHPEHGHFHLFLRAGALPEGVEPALGPRGEDRVAHLVAVSMDAWGYPTDLFAVNRWVTDESWLPADVIVSALDRFDIDHAYPSLPVNRWLGAMVRCFKPQIEALLYHRDAVVADQGGQDMGQVLEDRSLEITGSIPIDVEGWAASLEAEQERRQLAGARAVVAEHQQPEEV
ncbi:hypothetical protein [uncultured Marinobacter sp.]|uniref:DUF6969 family protein n=1 Tax=uncultured Marinobacter sp. TaxID=187379 RepID=UPI002614EDAD|nr:hypothetical protein [uncultured Marinobacter sp.]